MEGGNMGVSHKPLGHMEYVDLGYNKVVNLVT
jgi:hypothetical protein